MKKLYIQSITIYGYGKLENASWSLKHSTQVFYGENEAGKSTIMSFIHSILFGFPTKQQTELRYEPKTQHKYGGQLIVFFPKHGTATIERVKGKASGDVTVVMENGRRGQEELLAELLQGIDKQAYQSIFSFNLFGLQNAHQLKSAELGRFLFSTGAVGSDRLLEAENELQKELDSRFRPGGKKPLLNNKIKQLKEKYQQLKIAEKKNSTYEQLVHERKQMQERLKESGESQKSLEKEMQNLQEWIKLQPLVKEKEMVEESLSAYKDISFPIDGLIRWERVKEKLLSIESARQNVEIKAAKIKEAQDRLAPNHLLLNKETEIMQVLEKLPLLDQWKSRQTLIASQLDAINQEIMELEEKLYVSEEKELIESNTSIFLKEQCKNASSKQRRLLEKKAELDNQYNEEQTLLNNLEQQIDVLKNKLLSSEKRTKLEKKVNSVQFHSLYQQQVDSLKKAELEIGQLIDKNNKKKRQDVIQWGLFTIFLVLAALWGFFKEELFFAVIGGMATIMGVLFLFRSMQQTKSENARLQVKVEEIAKNKNGIKKAKEEGDTSDLSYAVEKLKEDDEYKEKYKMYKMQLEQQNERYEKVLRDFEKWEYEYHQNITELMKLTNELHISKEFASPFIYDAFLLIEEWKKKKREKNALLEEWNLLEADGKKLAEKIGLFYKKFLKEPAKDIQAMCFHLKGFIKEENEKRVRYSENIRKLDEYKKDIEGYNGELQVYIVEKEQLFKQAEAKCEEDFRQMGHKEEEKKQYKASLASIKVQIDRTRMQPDKIKKFMQIEDITAELQAAKKQVEELSQQQKRWMEHIAALNFDIEKLEAGGTYTDILHSYKQLKTEFEEDAKEWGKYAVAKQLLSNTVKQYKSKHLPKMLQKAEEHFTFLTEGKYIRIIPHDDGAGFLVESKEHLFFEANELSQGTAEQLYVSIRLALVNTFYAKYEMPLIIDDGFVNFDEKRTSRMIQLLKKLQQNQLLIFTCHPHIAAYFSAEEVFSFTSKPIISEQ